MKDSLKMVIPNALKGKREGDRKWKSRKLLIGDIQCELGIERAENILCKAISRASGCLCACWNVYQEEMGGEMVND